MFKSTSTSLILFGVLGVIVGIIAIGWPGVTVAALVILFAVYAFIGAGLQAVRAFSSATAGPVAGHLLLALIDLAAGVAALVWPAPTALVLVLVVAIWAFVAGFAEIFVAFASGETAGTRAMFILTGLISVGSTACRRSWPASRCAEPGRPCTRSCRMPPDRPGARASAVHLAGAPRGACQA